ncbi:hypothetical protein N9937_00090 [bacterium]|nr:hypothetical protein [bacterium]
MYVELIIWTILFAIVLIVITNRRLDALRQELVSDKIVLTAGVEDAIQVKLAVILQEWSESMLKNEQEAFTKAFEMHHPSFKSKVREEFEERLITNVRQQAMSSYDLEGLFVDVVKNELSGLVTKASKQIHIDLDKEKFLDSVIERINRKQIG